MGRIAPKIRRQNRLLSAIAEDANKPIYLIWRGYLTLSHCTPPNGCEWKAYDGVTHPGEFRGQLSRRLQSKSGLAILPGLQHSAATAHIAGQAEGHNNKEYGP
jgi:hypothetical protein